MTEKKFKFIFVKFLFFILFLYMLVSFFNTVKEKYYFLKNKREESTNEFIKLLEIRNPDFYKNEENLEKNNFIKTEKDELKKEDDIDTKKYFVTISTYSQEKNAKLKLEELKEFNVKIDKVKVNENVYYRLISEDFKNIKEADLFVKEIKRISKDEKPLIRVRY